APWVAHRSVGRGGLNAPLDLEDLPFLRRPQAVDIGDVAVGRALQRLELAVRIVGPDGPVALLFLEGIGGVAAKIADLDLGLFHPLVDDSHDVLATFLGQRRDIQPDDGAVHVRHQPDVALRDRLLDGTEDTAVPRLDHDLVRFGDADAGQLVERRRGAVVVDVDALDERGRRATRPDPLEIALHGLDRTTHLVVGIGDGLAAHVCAPPPAPDAPEMRFPTGSPAATRVMLSGRLRSNTTIGRSFSMHRLTAVASSTFSWSRSRSAYSRRA